MERVYGIDHVRIIHGNKTQQTRINAMQAFREEEGLRFLVTTDLAARGLDIPDVSHVINFDVPIIYEDYVHRIGRTGRAFKTGESLTFVTSADEYHLQKIQALIKQRIEKCDLPSEVDVVATPFEERQEMLREIDRQKRKENPEFKGAFHEKKAIGSKSDFKKAKRK